MVGVGVGITEGGPALCWEYFHEVTPFAISVAMLINVSLAMSTMAQETAQPNASQTANSAGASSDQLHPTPGTAPVLRRRLIRRPLSRHRLQHRAQRYPQQEQERYRGYRQPQRWKPRPRRLVLSRYRHKDWQAVRHDGGAERQAHPGPVITEYVNRIGQNLVRNSDAKVPFTIKVIHSDEINAFALPGGFFYVNSGLILAADEEAELAGVMAHEIAHVCARHATREMTRANYAQIATTPLMFVINSWGMYEATNIALSLAMPMAFMKFSRNFESEADYLGLQYMYKAGYDPQAFVSFFEKIQAREKQKPGTLSKAFSSHPPTPDRIAKSESEIKELLPSRPQYVVDTSEFDSVKSRLAAFEDRKKVIAPSDKDKPTLRQTKTADASTTAPENPNDDRPTLSRRDD